MTPESPTPDLTALIEPILPLDFERHESQTIKDAALRDRAALARKIAHALLAAGFGPVRAVEAERDALRKHAQEAAGVLIAAETARDAALRERDEARAEAKNNAEHAARWERSVFAAESRTTAALADAAGLRERLMHDTTRRLMAQEYLIDMSDYRGQDLTRHAQAMAAAVHAALATPDRHDDIGRIAPDSRNSEGI